MQEDANLIAALADAEVLRERLDGAERLLASEQRRANELAEAVVRADSRLTGMDERVRELHVLLLNRDQEIARLHGSSESARLSGAGPQQIAAPPPPKTLPSVAITLPAPALALGREAVHRLASASRWLRARASQRS